MSNASALWSTLLTAALGLAVACAGSAPSQPETTQHAGSSSGDGAQGDLQHRLGPPSGYVRIESRSIAAGLGVSWGEGVLTIGEQEHRFSLSGLSVADVGFSRVTATGKVWGLRELSQFEGTYYGVQAGVAVGGGGVGLAMRNEHGVYLRLKAVQQGVTLSLASKGTTIELE